jgi:7-keto-8-aminopelargonate synthetase-like enzyme
MQPVRDNSDDNLPPSGGWSMESAPGAETVLNGRRYVYFAGTGYLGLQGHPAVIAAMRAAAERYGVHTATSRAGFGTSPPTREVETRAARFLGADEAAYLASGYASNFAMLAALSDRVDVALADEHAHDSLCEATKMLARLETAPLVFRHRDARHVEDLLQRHVYGGRCALVLVDGVSPVSGDLAPIADYLSVLGRFDSAMLLVDDAHGLAVLGELGRGSLELAGASASAVNRDFDEHVAGPRVFHTSTLSKAVGGHGGVIAGSAAFLARLRGASGWFRGASAPAAAIAAATAKALEIVETEPQLRRQLAANVARLRGALVALGLPVERTPSPIVGVRLESAERMDRVQRRLAADGLLISHTRDYSGAGPDGMLRIAVFATHTHAMLDRLVDRLHAALEETSPS